MSGLIFVAKSIDDTERLGAALARLLPAGSVIALNGTLGAGKSRLVESVANQLGIDREQVTSPTFVLCQHYSGSRVIHHFDAYRLADDDEVLELGPEEYFESDGISFVEWSDRVAACIPPNHLRIDIAVIGKTQREFHISANDPRFHSLVRKLTEDLALEFKD